MPIAITLTLTTDQPATLTTHLGRANYAQTLHLLSAIDPTLAPLAHDGDGPKPLTCSSLLNARYRPDGLQVEVDRPYTVRITGLSDAICQGLEACLLHQPPQEWRIDDHPFTVQAVVCDSQRQPWSGRTSYETLAATQLLRSDRQPKQVTLEFASPTAFKSKEMTIPVPMPGLVFGSLVERWNAFSPITLSPEMRRYGEEMMAISRYRLESHAVEQKSGGRRVGGIGTVTYVALGGDRYWLGVMNMLADFAFYSGVGVQTATGMGQVRRLERE